MYGACGYLRDQSLPLSPCHFARFSHILNQIRVATKERLLAACISLFILTNTIAVLSLLAVTTGLSCLFAGFYLLHRQRCSASFAGAKAANAAPGLVEVHGFAVGPHTLTAPITGKPCFLYRTTVWQQADHRRQWQQVAEETLHLPFFIADSTGQLLVEPGGADLDLRPDFSRDFDATSLSHNPGNLPPRISVFLARHGIFPDRRFRIEEKSIKLEQPLFVAGTLMENPGVETRPFSPPSVASVLTIAKATSSQQPSAQPDSAQASSNPDCPPPVTPQVIRLAASAGASSSGGMTLQGKISAALTRAGAAQPDIWNFPEPPPEAATTKINAFSAPPSAQPLEPAQKRITNQVELSESSPRPLVPNELRVREVRMHQARPDHEPSPNENHSSSPGSTPAPATVLTKGATDPAFIISSRSQKQLANALTRKSVAMIWAGAAMTLLGLVILLLPA
jgi:hypothetical protein